MLHLLHLQNVPILDQLRLEEALLRTDDRNWCIINEGSPPAIVMGISGKPEELINTENTPASLPIIRRFSGGGTVVVDEQTLFVSYLFRKDHHTFSPFPEPILRWSEEIYKQALDLPNFHLRENDYVIGNLKCGGNAQYIRKNNWLHHTTFLWDYCPKKMDYLLLPKKAPSYRKQRKHTDFLTPLKEHLPSQKEFIENLKKTLSEDYELKEMSLKETISIQDQPHRQATTIVPLSDISPR